MTKTGHYNQAHHTKVKQLVYYAARPQNVSHREHWNEPTPKVSSVISRTRSRRSSFEIRLAIAPKDKVIITLAEAKVKDLGSLLQFMVETDKSYMDPKIDSIYYHNFVIIYCNFVKSSGYLSRKRNTIFLHYIVTLFFALMHPHTHCYA